MFTNSQVEVLIECRPDIARCPCTNVQVHSENNVRTSIPLASHVLCNYCNGMRANPANFKSR